MASPTLTSAQKIQQIKRATAIVKAMLSDNKTVLGKTTEENVSDLFTVGGYAGTSKEELMPLINEIMKL